VRIERLRVERLRNIAATELSPGPRLNLLLGGNGAGKTSVLEALHLLAYGRSFRAPQREVLIQRGAAEFSVFAEVRPAEDRPVRRVGLSASVRGWSGRVDGEAVASLGELLRCCPVVCFEPGSHALIAGPSELRRRYLDWGLFHVEPEFAEVWRRYQRALRQRNALLKSASGRRLGVQEGLDAWDTELADAGERLDGLRRAYIEQLQPLLVEVAARLIPEAGAATMSYASGWRRERESLAEALLVSQERDLALGHTSAGPHRGNWSLCYAELAQRESFSRGQEKLTALVCVLAQAQHFAERFGHWPIIALDDLGSELDAEHQSLAVDAVERSGAQVWVTGTFAPAGLNAETVALFHVEQGQVRPAV